MNQSIDQSINKQPTINKLMLFAHTIARCIIGENILALTHTTVEPECAADFQLKISILKFESSPYLPIIVIKLSPSPAVALIFVMFIKWLNTCF